MQQCRRIIKTLGVIKMKFYDFLEANAKADGIERLVVGAIITNEKEKYF